MENWSNLARVATMRTYSRDGENWTDIVERSIRGNIRGHDVKPGEVDSLRELMTNREATPAGRGLWFSGTEAHKEIGGIALANCWYLTGEKWEHLPLACDLLMLGGGVGMSVEHRYVSKLPKVRETEIEHKGTKDAFYIVPDSREGWCELLRIVFKSYFVTGRKFTYSTTCIRGKGEKIAGFGGTASGPLPLIKCIDKICTVLDRRAGKHVRPVDMADLVCCIGEMVVAGNVRRSAIIIIGDPWDREFLTCKRWDLKTVPVERQFANFSVSCSDTEDLHPSFWRTYEAGEPFGFINLENIQKYGRMGEEKIDTAIGVNPCVPGDTTILTDSGYERIDNLIGELVNVWNGEEWSEVTPKLTGYFQPVVEVTLSNGQSLTCTDSHEFITLDGPVAASELSIGQKLEKFEYPVVDFEGELSNAYSQGLYQGDGQTSGSRKSMKVYGVKRDLIPYVDCEKGSEYDNYTSVLLDFKPKAKCFVPDNYSVKSRLEWLSGYADSDGYICVDGGLQITCIDKQTLLDVQTMLTMTGCPSKVVKGNDGGLKSMPDGDGGKKEYYCKPTYRILIGAMQVKFLNSLGFHPRRLKLKLNPNRDASRFVYVTSVARAAESHTVYCFNEPKAHRGCFNGVVTGQCAEATLENGEPCNLLELFMTRLRDKEHFAKAARLMFRWGKRVCQEDYHHELINEVIHRNNRIGVGITGCLQSVLFNPNDLDYVYGEIQEENREYSAFLGAPESIRTTVIKPSGTLSLVGDCTAGIHPAYAEWYIRRVRFAENSPLIPELRAAGHNIQPQKNIDGTLDYGTLVVDFPVHMVDTPTADQLTTWQQLEVVKMAQKHWADQSISVTVYYKKSEINELKQWVSENLRYLKTLSFLCYDDHGFEQAPMEKISEQEYDRISNKITPINFDGADAGELLEECEGGSCPVR